MIPRNNKRLVPTLKERYPAEPSPLDTPLAAARARTLRSTLEANGVDAPQVARRKAKQQKLTAAAAAVAAAGGNVAAAPSALPATYRAPLVAAAQVWALRIEKRASERRVRRAAEAQSRADKAAFVAAATAAAQQATAQQAAMAAAGTDAKAAAGVAL